MFKYYVILFQGILAGFTPQSRVLSVDFLSTLEKAVVRELNLARQNPKKYASFLERQKPYYVGKHIKRPGKTTVITSEGVSAVNEAIRFLRSVKPVSALKPARGMSLGARDHVRDQGPTGRVGHRSSDGSQFDDRIKRYGSSSGIIGENIAYGSQTAREIVLGLIIDDGVPNRGHRKNIFSPHFRVVGVACGYHLIYRTMCVITFAGRYKDNDEK